MDRTACSEPQCLYKGAIYGLDDPGIQSRWEARFSAPVQNGPRAHPSSCKTGTGSFPGVKNGRCVTLTPHSLLVPWSRKSRAIPVLLLWTVRTVQSLSACTRMHFTCCISAVGSFWLKWLLSWNVFFSRFFFLFTSFLWLVMRKPSRDTFNKMYIQFYNTACT